MKSRVMLAVVCLVLAAPAGAQEDFPVRGRDAVLQPPGRGDFPPGVPPMPGGLPGPGPGAPQIDHKELVGALLEVLPDKDVLIRQGVAAALTRIGQPAVGPLVAIVKDTDKNKELRANAAYILGKIGPTAREAVPVLTRALKEKDADRELRRRLVFALASIIGNDYGPGFGMGPGMPMMPGMTGTVSATAKVPDPGLLVPDARDETKPARPDEEKK